MRTYKHNSRRGTRIPIRHKRRFGHLAAPLQDELNSLFDEVLSDSELGNKNPGKGWPTMHVSENAKTFDIRIEAPCMLAEDFNVTTTYDFIIIRAEKRKPKQSRAKDTGCVFFHRTLSLPESATPARATASFSKGILNIIVPKGSRRELTLDHVSSI
jgi:HSP20 family molecular chaperone IbpA